MLEKFFNANIDVFTFVAHASQAMQPLDLGFFKTFKEALRKFKKTLLSASTSENRLNTLNATRDAIYVAHNPATVKLCFSHAGLYPLDPTKVLKHPSVTMSNLVEPKIPSKKYKQSSINAKCISSPDVFNQIMVEKVAQKEKEEMKKTTNKRKRTPKK